MRLADCIPARDVHRADIRNPGYRFWYTLTWLPNQAQIAWLRLRIHLGGRDGPG